MTSRERRRCVHCRDLRCSRVVRRRHRNDAHSAELLRRRFDPSSTTVTCRPSSDASNVASASTSSLNGDDDVDVVDRRVVAKERMEQTLLHEGARETFLTDADHAAVHPSFGHRTRAARETQQSPRRSAAQEVAVEELRALIQDHLRPRGDRDLDRQRCQREKLAHRLSLARFVPVRAGGRARMGVSEEERCRVTR